jgi:hypothetical protein
VVWTSPPWRFAALLLAVAVVVRVPRELEPTVVIHSETELFNFGLFMAAAGPYLAIEDRDASGKFVLRIGQMSDGKFVDEARFPLRGWVFQIAGSDDAFAWRSTEGVFVVRRIERKWKLESFDLDETCMYVPESKRYVWIEKDVIVVNSAPNVCIFERRLKWRRTAVIPHAAREHVAYTNGKLIINVMATDLVDVYTRDRRWQRTRSIQLAKPSRYDGFEASGRWLAVKSGNYYDVDIYDLDNGKRREHFARDYTGDFAITKDRLLIDHPYEEADVYKFTGTRWDHEARLRRPAKTKARLALGDHAWTCLYNWENEPGRVEGFLLP